MPMPRIKELASPLGENNRANAQNTAAQQTPNTKESTSTRARKFAMRSRYVICAWFKGLIPKSAEEVFEEDENAVREYMWGGYK